MGYGYSSGNGFFGFLLFVMCVCYLVAWILAMGIVTKAAKEKGYDNLGGKLWFIGLFGFVFTPAIIVAALPDKRVQAGLIDSTAAGTSQASLEDELPEL